MAKLKAATRNRLPNSDSKQLDTLPGLKAGESVNIAAGHIPYAEFCVKLRRAIEIETHGAVVDQS